MFRQRKKYSPERIIALYRKYGSSEVVARKVNISSSTVLRVLERNGVDKEWRGYNMLKITPGQISTFIEEYLKGKSSVDIAKIYNIHPCTVMYHIKKIRPEIVRNQSESRKLACHEGKDRESHERGRHSSKIENLFLSYVEKHLRMKFERNQYNKRTYCVGPWAFDAKYGNMLFEIDGSAHKYDGTKAWLRQHKRLQSAEDIGCKVIHIPVKHKSGPMFNRALLLIKPYLECTS